MADNQNLGQPSVEEILDKIDQSPIGEMLRDEQAMERMIFDLMTRSEDSVVREMGTELREGNITMRGLADIPAYRSAMEAGLERVGELDLASMSEQLDELIAEQQESAPDEDAGESDEEPDELWQGFGRLDDR
ncbi:hypothetical protein [Haloechinothrix salitolerans]|uniref:YbaB/EbfC DNA-binding family protein n=1 Tax=Haloechinothrix salitolerans TaxID=926830 RepID=A0ABW2BR73_9PSEU